MSTTRLLVIVYLSEDITPGVRSSVFLCETRQKAEWEARTALEERACPGEWALVLREQDGHVVRRYRTDELGTVYRDDR